MAYVANTRSQAFHITDWAKVAFENISERYAKYALFRKTLRELDALSTRELADLGLHRSMLKSVAYEAAHNEI